MDSQKETGSAPSSDKPTIEGYGEPSSTATKEPEAQGDQFDDLGYPITPATTETEVKPAKEEPKASEAQTEDIKDPVTQYGDEPPEVEKTEPEKTVDDPKEKPVSETKDQFKISEKGDLLDDEVKSLEGFINKHKLSKEVADALVEEKKQEIKRSLDAVRSEQAKRKQLVNETKQKWYNELKTDKEFGGENFSSNVKQAEKVIQDFFPNLKKELTESRRMLPPFVMKDLASLAKSLYSKGTTFKEGSPVTAEKGDEKSDDPLSFYE